MLVVIDDLIQLLNKKAILKYIFYIVSVICIFKILYIDIYKNTFEKLININKALSDFRDFIYKSLANISNKLDDIEKDTKTLLKKNKNKDD